MLLLASPLEKAGPVSRRMANWPTNFRACPERGMARVHCGCKSAWPSHSHRREHPREDLISLLSSGGSRWAKTDGRTTSSASSAAAARRCRTTGRTLSNTVVRLLMQPGAGSCRLTQDRSSCPKPSKKGSDGSSLHPKLIIEMASWSCDSERVDPATQHPCGNHDGTRWDEARTSMSFGLSYLIWASTLDRTGALAHDRLNGDESWPQRAARSIAESPARPRCGRVLHSRNALRGSEPPERSL